jgi:YggT family protein
MIAIVIHTVFNILNLIILADIIVSFFLSPYHVVRATLDRIVNPMLAPIRRVLPQVGMFDFSPIVLILILQVLEYLLLMVFK